jgi:uncharacterized protein (DUF433 family)
VRDGRRFAVPLMTVHEAGVHLGIPPSTVGQWVKPRTERAAVMHSVPAQTSRGPKLPFIAIAEAQVLRELRGIGLSMQHLRESVYHLRELTGEEYVLASRDIAASGSDLLFNAVTLGAPDWVRARDGQGAIQPVINDLLRYVRYAEDGFAERLTLRPYGSAEVILDPRFGFGQPVLERNKVRVETLADLFYAGETIETIADEYDLTTEEVEAVVRVLSRRAA